MEYDVKGPFEEIHCKSHLVKITTISFDAVLPEERIKISFSHNITPGKPCSFDYQSSNGDFGYTQIESVSSKEPEHLAEQVLNVLEKKGDYHIENIEKNYVDLNLPNLVTNGPIFPATSSDISKTERIEGAVLMADLRSFSTWEASAAPEIVQEVIDVIVERIVQMQIDYYYDYWKLLGDGVMLVWHSSGKDNVSNMAIHAAYELHKHYWYFRRAYSEKIPDGFGIAIDSGYLTQFLSRTFFESAVIQDYIGPEITWAARIQSSSNPGETLVSRRVARTMKDEWLTAENISDSVDRAFNFKGIPESKREVYKIHHKYFNDDWEHFVNIG